MKQPSRKPIFQNPEPMTTDFSQLVDAEFQAAKARDPNIKYEKVLAKLAQERPDLYEAHAHKVGGDKYATLDGVESPYFKKVSDLYFSELKKVDHDAQPAAAVAQCAALYPSLFEAHLAGKLGVFIPQTRVQLSDRKELPAKMGKGVTLDRLAFARRCFPRLVADRWAELKQDDRDAKYEAALRETASRFLEVHQDYILSLAA